jgi:hypothetical protein
VGDLAFEKDAKLSVKIGFGLGKVKIIHVGGVGGRVEYLPVGTPLSEAFEAEHLAETGGVIIIPNNIQNMIRDHFNLERIDKEHSTHSVNGPFFYVKSQMGSQMMVKAGAQLVRSNLERSELILLKNSVRSMVMIRCSSTSLGACFPISRWIWRESARASLL